MPSTEISADEIGEGMNIIVLLEKCGLISSRGDGRRLAEQGGIAINGQKITAFNHLVTKNDFDGGSAVIQKGKKVFHKVIIA
jgi:tyrosyl-tRNA synthetase